MIFATIKRTVYTITTLNNVTTLNARICEYLGWLLYTLSALHTYFIFLHIRVYMYNLLHCALSLAAQCIVIGPVCNGRTTGGRAGGRAVSEPYYSQRARSVCVSLSAYVHIIL